MTASRTAHGTVSIVTPVLNEQECLDAFYRRTTAVLAASGLDDYEIVLIDDGSTDRTPAILADLAQADPRVKVITLSRRFGHHPAVFAGLEFASGDTVVIIDGDLQDPPELIPQLVAERDKGYELVFAQRVEAHQGGVILRALKRAFRRLMRRLASIDFPDNIGVFSAMDRSLKDVLLQMPERERYLVAMQMYLGFRVGFVPYVRQDRHAGRPKQDLTRLVRLGMNSIFSYSSLPLRFSVLASLVCLLLSLVALAYVLYSRMIAGTATVGWASVMTAVLGLGAIQLFSLWIVSEYVDRIFENVKSRPYYIIRRVAGRRGLPAAEHSS
jgi:dolichol-phosphate mannosyltransferase